jgi:hypothetical protein
MRNLRLLLLASLVVISGRVSASPSSMQQGATNVPASPTVLVSVLARGAGGALDAELLTFWRGRARWFSGSQRSSGGGSATHRTQTLTFGDVYLSLELQLAPRRVIVAEETRDLGTANVVLVDDVDASTGPRLVKTLTVELSQGDFVDLAVQAAAASAEVRAFLQCPESGAAPVSPAYVVCHRLGVK